MNRYRGKTYLENLYICCQVLKRAQAFALDESNPLTDRERVRGDIIDMLLILKRDFDYEPRA